MAEMTGLSIRSGHKKVLVERGSTVLQSVRPALDIVYDFYCSFYQYNTSANISYKATTYVTDGIYTFYFRFSL